MRRIQLVFIVYNKERARHKLDRPKVLINSKRLGAFITARGSLETMASTSHWPRYQTPLSSAAEVGCRRSFRSRCSLSIRKPRVRHQTGIHYTKWDDDDSLFRNNRHRCHGLGELVRAASNFIRCRIEFSVCVYVTAAERWAPVKGGVRPEFVSMLMLASRPPRKERSLI